MVSLCKGGNEPQGIINSVKKFKYLGSVFHEPGNCKANIE